MTRRPQVLRVTDSATTRSSRRQLSQEVPPPQLHSPPDASPQCSPRCSPHRSPPDSPQRSPRPSPQTSPQASPRPSSPAGDQSQTYVSQSSVTLRGVPVYDEYLCADHRWVRSADSAGARRHSGSEEDVGGAGSGRDRSNISSSSSCGSSYVTWTKSSLRSKQWQLLHSTSAPDPAPSQPAASRMLKEADLMEAGADEGCVAVLAPCPATPAVSLVTLAGKAADDKPPHPQPHKSRRPEHQRHQRHHSEFDGLLQYLQDYRHGLRELLVNNNVVIIEPVRASVRHPADQRDPRDDRRAHSAPVDDHRDDKTCRITGAIVKSLSASQADGGRGSASNNTLPRSQKPHQPILRRQFFYHPIKINKELVDAELPDPDTVRNARKVFERAAPLGVKAGLGLSALTGLSHSQSVLDKRSCWTDSGSLSSGVSSDLSCCDLSTSCDTDLRTGTFSSGSQLSQREVFSSGDESEPDQPHQVPVQTQPGGPAGCGPDGNPVSEDVLQKIRACGTTVTYFGGQVIACSGAGPARSPMTMAIMEEIRRSARPLVGIKFRLVKSNSCGSRLELAGQTGGPGAGRWKRAAFTTPDALGERARRGGGEREEQTVSVDMREEAWTRDGPREDAPRAAAAAAAAQEGPASATGTEPPAAEQPRVEASKPAAPPAAAQTPSPHKTEPPKVEPAAAEPPKSEGRAAEPREHREPATGGQEDKENRPVVVGSALTSWKMAGGKAVNGDFKRPPLPVPQQPDKFGIMEFEEFQFID